MIVLTKNKNKNIYFILGYEPPPQLQGHVADSDKGKHTISYKFVSTS